MLHAVPLSLFLLCFLSAIPLVFIMGDDEHRARLQRNLRHAGSASQDLAIRHGRALPPPLPTSDIDHDFREQQDDLLQQFSNHYAPYEGFDLLVSTFEKTVDGTVRATFRDGHRLAVVDENAVKLKVGLTFLPGADTPSVNQLEMMSMTQTTPDQRDPAWRVTTAGALLFNTTVHDDMTISFADNTAAVVRANRKRVSGDGPFTDPNVGSRALAVRKTVDRIVTIDSDNVKLVNELHSEKWDLEAVLVEVDQASLMDLISNYQKVIRKGGPDLPTTEIVCYYPCCILTLTIADRIARCNDRGCSSSLHSQPGALPYDHSSPDRCFKEHQIWCRRWYDVQDSDYFGWYQEHHTSQLLLLQLTSPRQSRKRYYRKAEDPFGSSAPLLSNACAPTFSPE